MGKFGSVLLSLAIVSLSGLYPTILGIGPWPNKIGKKINLMGKMNYIIMSTSTTNESKIYPQNQVILHFFLCQAQVCKYHSDTGHDSLSYFHK